MDKKTAHTKEELVSIFREQNVPETFFPKFLAYYKFCFEEFFGDMKNFEDDDFDEGDSIQESALRCTKYFMKPYIELINKGHGDEWSHSLASSSNDGEMAVFHTHYEIKQMNPELAKKELLIHTKSLGGDKYFQKHFIYLFDNVAEPDNRIETAEKYSKIYKEEIAKGKSEVYANEYASLMAEGESHEIYCEDYAIAFDKAIKENKSDEYAGLYAYEYGCALVDIKRRYGISDNEEMIEFAIEKVNAYMNAWVYGKENRLKGFEEFSEIYENIHLNTYFADEGRPDGSRDEIDRMILKKALGKFLK